MPKPTELNLFTFKDTGVQVLIRKVSPLLIMEVQQSIKKPEPPLQEVDYGDGAKKMEPNPAHPDYIIAMKKYETDVELAIRKLIIKRGVALEMTQEMKDEVKELRKFMKEEYSITLDSNDVMVYVSNIAIGSDMDMEELINAIIRRSQPTEVAVKEATDLFQGNVPR